MSYICVLYFPQPMTELEDSIYAHWLINSVFRMCIFVSIGYCHVTNHPKSVTLKNKTIPLFFNLKKSKMEWGGHLGAHPHADFMLVSAGRAARLCWPGPGLAVPGWALWSLADWPEAGWSWMAVAGMSWLPSWDFCNLQQLSLGLFSGWWPREAPEMHKRFF